MDYNQLLEGIQAHPYATTVAASVVNGKATAIVVGAFVAQGYVNPIVAYAIFVVMDILGDTLYYFLGRLGYLGGKIIIKDSWRQKLNQPNEKFAKHFLWALFIGKVSLVGSKPTILAAGITRMSLVKFYGVIVPCTLVLYLLCMGLGYFFLRIL